MPRPARPQGCDWQNDVVVMYPKDSKFIIDNIYSNMEAVGDTHIDNWRFYLLEDEVARREYEDAVKNGCCDFFDKKIYNPKSGKIYWIGFNYGHQIEI